jgi:hypothetical protein
MNLACDNRRLRYLDSKTDPGFSSLRWNLILADRPDEGQATNSGF